ncbi:MAG: hypothetical protein M5U34_02245 [Chloroflexi bacterium]|nr:hypothetical protein [Chloroflexota bacterium]
MRESTLFKDKLNPLVARSFGAQIQHIYPPFSVHAFVAQIEPQLAAVGAQRTGGCVHRSLALIICHLITPKPLTF